MRSAKRKSDGDDHLHRKKQQNTMQEQLKAKHLETLAKKPDEEKCLENLIFGGEDVFVDRLLGDSKIRVDPSVDLLESDSENEWEEDPAGSSKKPAWVDEDDEDEEMIRARYSRKHLKKNRGEVELNKKELQVRLQRDFQKTMGGVPSWASKDPKKRLSKEDEDDDDEDDNEDNLLSKTGNLLAKSTYLPKGILQIRKCLNANSERSSKVPLSTVQFHPLSQVVMTAGHDRSIALFQVDGKLNPKIQSIYIKKFPIFKARFSADGEQVIATGLRHPTFYVYDMMVGKIIPVTRILGLKEKCLRSFDVSPDGSFLSFIGTSGYLHMLSAKTRELIGSMKMNALSTQAVFSPDCSKIFSTSVDGDVYVWDVGSRRCLNRFADDGSLFGSSLAVSKDGRYLSCGSNSGVVNVYNYEDCVQNSAPKPIKSIMNLVTKVSSQVFSPNSEILAISSKKANDAVKLVHIPSFTVFSNFPVQSKGKTIRYVQAMDFSPHSGFFSIANNKGEALLYRLKHYSAF